jgi:hypothetical protein
MPRHPPFALNNLTTKNKMLASTVQFSTNDQPTTHSPTPNPQPTDQPANVLKRYMGPGHAWLKQQPSSPESLPEAPAPTYRGRPWLFLQDPTGCYIASPSRIHNGFPYPYALPEGTTGRTHAVNRCRL